ncbi:hypothetical protein HRG84_23525 [Flavisolibacter sp. BT320]|nr:hypothetical protein [Flavisolibacter longurius]
MAKQFFIILFLKFSFFACFAQPVPAAQSNTPSQDRPNPRPIVTPPRREASPLTVILQANHNFYLKVDNKDFGKVEKEQKKTVQLKPGVRKLTFEEADSTGERIEHYIKVTREMIRQKDTLFAINFKTDFLEIIQPKQSSETGSNNQKQR